MFHSLMAAITSFFLSLTQQPAQQVKPNDIKQSKTTPYSSQSQNGSFYYFDGEDHIRVHLYVGDNEGIDAANAQKRYYFRGSVLADGCIVESIEPDIRNKFEITNISYIDFGVKFAAPCSAKRIVVNGEKIVENVVFVDGKVYTSSKKSRLAPIVLSNLVLDDDVFIQLVTQGEIKLQSQEERRVIVKLVDKNGAQIDPQKIESITVRTLDSSKLQFVDSDGSLKGIIEIENPSDSSIALLLKSVGGAGSVGFEVRARIKGVKVTFTTKKEFAVTIEKSPIVDVQIFLQPQQETLVAGDVYYINYSLKNGQELLSTEEIDKIDVSVENAKIIYQNQEFTDLTLHNPNSSGTLYIRPLQAKNNAKVCLSLYLISGKVIEKEILLAVVDEPLSQISINPVKTEYIPSKNMYKSQFVVHVQGGRPYERYSVDVITPKIIYPNAYYSGFISGRLDYENSNVFYNGIQIGDYSGKIEQKDMTQFSSYRYDFNQVDIGNDRLIILPNKYVTDKTIIGNWNIVDLQDGKLILAEEANKTQDKLSFVIGSEVRYDPIHYTLATMTLDSLDHVYSLDENSSFTFSVTYPPFMTGKDVFIGVHRIDSNKRVGNSLKFTLQGTGLSYPKEFSCAERSMCVWRITIKQEDSGERLTYSRIERNCQATKGRYTLLTSYNMKIRGCSSSYLSDRELKTDDKGYVYLCIYPDIKYKDIETNESGGTQRVPDGYEEATVTCEFELDEEFPY